MINAIVSFVLSVLKLKSKTNILATVQAVAGGLVVIMPVFDQLLAGNNKLVGVAMILKSVVDAILRWKTTQSVQSKL